MTTDQMNPTIKQSLALAELFAQERDNVERLGETARKALAGRVPEETLEKQFFDVICGFLAPEYEGIFAAFGYARYIDWELDRPLREAAEAAWVASEGWPPDDDLPW